MFLATSCESWTGNIIYSDSYVQLGNHHDITDWEERPLLNHLAAVPVVGSLAGGIRVALAVIHILGHSLAAVVLWNREHLFHVIKGGAELIRGIIEVIPVIGRIFSWTYDAQLPWFHDCGAHTQERATFFLVKVYNPVHLTNGDQAFGL